MNKLNLSIAAIVLGLMATACTTSDPDVAAQIEAQSERLNRLESQVAELSTSIDAIASENDEASGEHEAKEASAFELSVAQHVMDTAGFHSMEDTLVDTGEIDPTYASTVLRVARVLNSVQWPHDLSEGAAQLLEILNELQSALADDDAEAATPLAGTAHEHQHDLSAAITSWLGAEFGEHDHNDE